MPLVYSVALDILLERGPLRPLGHTRATAQRFGGWCPYGTSLRDGEEGEPPHLLRGSCPSYRGGIPCQAMFKSFKVSLLLVSLALLGLAALPAYPRTETASLDLRPTEVENARTLLGERPGGEKADPGRGASARDGAGSGGEMALSIPKLGLEDVEVPTADSQVALDREGIIRLQGTGTPWEEGSNTVIVGHALGFVFTKVPYVFYEFDTMEPGDEITIEDRDGERYTFRVYDRLVVRPEDYWVTYPVPDKTIVSLQTCTPIPSFEKRLIVRAERIG